MIQNYKYWNIDKLQPSVADSCLLLSSYFLLKGRYDSVDHKLPQHASERHWQWNADPVHRAGRPLHDLEEYPAKTCSDIGTVGFTLMLSDWAVGNCIFIGNSQRRPDNSWSVQLATRRQPLQLYHEFCAIWHQSSRPYVYPPASWSSHRWGVASKSCSTIRENITSYDTTWVSNPRASATSFLFLFREFDSCFNADTTQPIRS